MNLTAQVELWHLIVTVTVGLVVPWVVSELRRSAWRAKVDAKDEQLADAIRTLAESVKELQKQLHAADLPRMEKELQELRSCVFGNGREGIMTTVQTIASDLRHLVARIDRCPAMQPQARHESPKGD
jgi:outer membrane murein-binding lipoprotein Lpp